MSTHCKARQHSDQMVCGHCGTAWDVNDPDPPLCGLTAAPARNSGAPPAERRVDDVGVPVERRAQVFDERRRPPRETELYDAAKPVAVTERGKTALRLMLAVLKDKTEAAQHMPANPGQRKTPPKE